MKVHVLSKHHFDDLMTKNNISDDNVETNKQCCFISINCSMGTDEVPYFKNNCSNVLIQFFDDVDDKDIVTKEGTAKSFTVAQAKEIIEFIEQNKDKEKCILHCAAGVSRSGAVGTFVSDYFRNDFFAFSKQHPHILPNSHVLRTLKREAYSPKF